MEQHVGRFGGGQQYLAYAAAVPADFLQHVHLSLTAPTPKLAPARASWAGAGWQLRSPLLKPVCPNLPMVCRWASARASWAE